MTRKMWSFGHLGPRDTRWGQFLLKVQVEEAEHGPENGGPGPFGRSGGSQMWRGDGEAECGLGAGEVSPRYEVLGGAGPTYTPAPGSASTVL